MSKKMIVSIIIILLAVIMVSDFRVNKIWVFESYARQMETSSLRELQHGNLHLSDFQGLKTVINTNGMIIDISDKDIIGLKIDNQLGSVIITGEDRQDLELNYKITIYSEKGLVEEALKNMKIISSLKDNNLELSRERIELPPYVRGIRIDYDIRVPHTLLLDISNRYGELVVSGMKNDVNLSNYYEQLKVTAIDGNADLVARYGSLFVENVTGSTEVSTAYNNTEIYNLGNDLTLESKYGAVLINGVKGYVDLDTSYGSLSIEEIEKDLKLDSKFTQVRGQDIKGNIEAKMDYGILDLFELTNSISFRGHYTNVNIDLSNNLKDYHVFCRVESGDIKTNLPYKVEKDNNNRIIEGTSGDEEIKISLETSRANISLYK